MYMHVALNFNNVFHVPHYVIVCTVDNDVDPFPSTLHVLVLLKERQCSPLTLVMGV